jgi:hypothetical protein
MDACDGCGFVYEPERATEAGAAILGDADAIADALRSGRAEVRMRPEPEVWSPLEYGAHVRDVLLSQRERVILARILDNPESHPIFRDARVELDGYAAQDPDAVARQVVDAATMFANVLDRVDAAGEWDRTMVYNYPEPSSRSIAWVAVHTQHELRHHRGDVERPLG